MKGSINLEDVTQLQTNYPSHPLRFSLTTEKRVYFMDAQTKEEMDSWTHALTVLGEFVVKETHAEDDEGIGVFHCHA